MIEGSIQMRKSQQIRSKRDALRRRGVHAATLRRRIASGITTTALTSDPFYIPPEFDRRKR
jgi:hypothetical protein